MSYRVIVAPPAGRRLAERLPESVAAACVEFIDRSAGGESASGGVALLPPFEGQWRARRGEYRVRYIIDDDQQDVLVVDIDHRRDAFRRP